MRILHCTDFHGNKVWFHWLAQCAKDYELVCLTGDHINLLEVRRLDAQLRMVRDALKRVVAPVALCSGNHDSFSGPPAPRSLHHAAWIRGLRRSGVWVDGDVFDLGGQRIRCLGWDVPVPSASENDIWLFHAPPAGTPTAVDLWDGDAGDEILGELCRAGKGPGIVLSGHQHAPKHWAVCVGRTWCLNPGRDPNALVPNYIVVDTVTRTAQLVRGGRPRGRVRLRVLADRTGR